MHSFLVNRYICALRLPPHAAHVFGISTPLGQIYGNGTPNGMSRLARSSARRILRRRAYFLPDFLMPWDPVFKGPLPLPTVLARSSRAFLSVPLSVCVSGAHLSIRLKMLRLQPDIRSASRHSGVVSTGKRKHTSSELGLVCEVVLIELLGLLLGLFVVNGIRPGCRISSAHTLG